MRAPPESESADDRRAVLDRQIHDLADLLGVRFGQRATEDGEVLAVHEDEPPVDAAVAGDDAVAEVALLVEAEVGGAMRDERIDLGEAVVVEQELESFAGRELAARVLLFEPLRSPAQSRIAAHRGQPFELVGSRHARTPSSMHRVVWARQESNLRPSGYEPVALTIELRARWRDGGQLRV